MDGITEFAKLFKERDNILYQGPQTGIVLSPPPEIQISIGDQIVLKKNHLIIAAHVLGDYQRENEIVGTIENEGLSGSLTLNDMSQSLSAGTESGSTTVKGTITYKDTLKTGEEVILIPSTDNQLYFLVDKAVRL